MQKDQLKEKGLRCMEGCFITKASRPYFVDPLPKQGDFFKKKEIELKF